jgi:hypothetical protein
MHACSKDAICDGHYPTQAAIDICDCVGVKMHVPISLNMAKSGSLL